MSVTNPAVAAARLRALEPINQLTQAAFRDLLKQTTFRSLPAGTRLYRAGESDDWSFYLIEGTVELFGESASRTVNSTNCKACEAALGHAPIRGETAKAKSDCMVARLPASLLELLMSGDSAAGGDYEVSELDAEEQTLESELLLRIYEDYSNDTLEIPSLPDLAFQIRRAIEDPNVNSERVERIVTADPAIAARLIRVANSPAYSGAYRVENCRDAVTRLGLTATRELVTSLLVKQLFHTDSRILKSAMKRVWEHSTTVAAVACRLAQLLPGFSPDRALLAGLIHDIGALPIIAAAQQHLPALGEAAVSEGALDEAIAKLRAEVGAMVLQKWEFPEDLVEVVLNAELWDRPGDGPADYGDLVVVSQLFSYVGTPENGRYPALSSLPVFERIRLAEVTPEQTLELLDEAQESIAELKHLLGAG